jgi:2-methylisocitrate lyase-like PEP mutase family enzyme
MGVAACVGLPDGRRGSRDATVQIAQALEAVPVHITADIEDGYADDPAEVAAFVDALPVAGLNIEDSRDDHLVAPQQVADKVAAIKQRRPDVFVNVRVDTFWFHEDDTVESTLERAAVYVAAGADGIFVPGVTDGDVIARLAGPLDVPLNVLAVPGASLEDLGRLGVRRVSTGSLPYRVALQAALDTAEAVRVGGDLPGALSYPAVQGILSA